MFCAMWIAINMSLGAVSEGGVWRGGTMGPVGGGGEGVSHGLSHQTNWLLAPTFRWLKAATGLLVACCWGNFFNAKYENDNCAADFSLLNLPKGKSLGRTL
jgi:hypothetical protein